MQRARHGPAHFTRVAHARGAAIAVVLTIGLASGLGACRGVLGIDEDVPLLTDGGPGSEGGVPGDGSDGDGSADRDGGPDIDGGDAAFDAGEVPVDRRYAVWPIAPDKLPLAQFDTTSETVTDTTTGLMWQRGDAVPVVQSYTDGKPYCDGLGAGGHTDWRMPTRIELFTIFDYTLQASLVNPAIFPTGTAPGSTDLQWTSSLSLLRSRLDERLVVSTAYSSVSVSTGDALMNRVRCVRGGPTTSPAVRFQVTATTARDVRTGLEWQRSPLAQPKTVPNGETECAAIGTGWRLPTVRELATLIDEARETKPLLPAIFAAGPLPRTWSRTRRANPANANYAVDMDTANVHQDDFATVTYSVRCVR